MHDDEAHKAKREANMLPEDHPVMIISINAMALHGIDERECPISAILSDGPASIKALHVAALMCKDCLLLLNNIRLTVAVEYDFKILGNIKSCFLCVGLDVPSDNAIGLGRLVQYNCHQGRLAAQSHIQNPSMLVITCNEKIILLFPESSIYR